MKSAPAKITTGPFAQKLPNQLDHIKFMTYNIDGLNPAALKYRTNTILGLIISEDADIVQLQEVVAETAPVLIQALTANGYSSFHQNDDFARMCHYFTLTFAKTSKVECAKISRVPYYGHAASQQGRDLLLLRLNYGNIPWLFANCHLESCGVAFKSTGSTIRQAQLHEGLSLLAQQSFPAILGGDLNIRDAEASKVMERYTDTIVDASIELEKGRKSNTWYMPNPSKYSARYDRVYSNRAYGLTPQAIKLIGGDDIYLDMLPTDVRSESELPYRTPSDHRGVVVTYAFISGNGNGRLLMSGSLKQPRSSTTTTSLEDTSGGKGPVRSTTGIAEAAGSKVGSSSATKIAAGSAPPATDSAHNATSFHSSSTSSSSSSRKRGSDHIAPPSSSSPTASHATASKPVEIIVIDSSDDETCVPSTKAPRTGPTSTNSATYCNLLGSSSSSSSGGTIGSGRDIYTGSAIDEQGGDVSSAGTSTATASADCTDDRARRRELQLQAAERRGGGVR